MMGFLRDLREKFSRMIGDERGFWDFDIGQWFTPPKDKSPWEAATRGSTGGWAKPFAPGESLGFVGPVLTTAAGAIPGVGPAISAGMGAAGMMGGEGSWLGDTGFQGTDYGWEGNLLPTAMGGVSGFGAGQFGKSLGSGLQAALSSTGTVGSGAGEMSLLSAGGEAVKDMAPLNKFMEGFGSTGLGGMFNGSGSLTSGTGAKAMSGVANALSPSTGATTTAATGASNSILGNVGKTLLGMGLAGAGQMATVPDAPPMGEVTSKWMTGDAVTKIGKLSSDWAEQKFLGDTWSVSDETNAMIDVLEKDITKSYEENFKKNTDRMSAFDQNYRRSGAFREDMLDNSEKMNNEITKVKAEMMYSDKQKFTTNQYNYVMDNLKVDDQTKQMLLYADIADVVNQYQVNRDDVLELRKLARDAGLYVMASGMGGV